MCPESHRPSGLTSEPTCCPQSHLTNGGRGQVPWRTTAGTHGVGWMCGVGGKRPGSGLLIPPQGFPSTCHSSTLDGRERQMGPQSQHGPAKQKLPKGSFPWYGNQLTLPLSYTKALQFFKVTLGRAPLHPRQDPFHQVPLSCTRPIT